MKVLLLPNYQKDNCDKITKNVIDVLKKGNAEIFSLNEFKQNLVENEVCFFNSDEISSDIDFAVTIGGDGTIIKAANLLLEYQIPAATLRHRLK